MPYRKSNESVVETTEEEDGADYNATNKAKGPTWTQNGVDLRDEDWAQRPCSTSRDCQPAHVHTLQRQPQPIHQTRIKLFISYFWDHALNLLTWGFGPRILEYRVYDMTLQAGYPTPIRMSDVMYWARWIAGVYWHHVCPYGQPVGSNELLEATVTSDILLRKVLFLRSVMIKQYSKYSLRYAAKIQHPVSLVYALQPRRLMLVILKLIVWQRVQIKNMQTHLPIVFSGSGFPKEAEWKSRRI